MPRTKSADGSDAKALKLEEEIARQEARLKKLQNELKERKRKDQERNTKSILALLQAEGLDQISSSKWTSVLPELRKLLGVSASTNGAPRVIE